MARKQSSSSGCVGLVGGLILLGFAVKFWFVVLPVIGAIIIIALAVQASEKKQAIARTAAEMRRLAETFGVLNPEDDLRSRPDKEVIEIGGSLVRYRNLIVLYQGLSGKALALAHRTVSAVSAIMASPEYKAGTCGSLPAKELRRHAWEIAVALREFTERAAEIPASSVGPIAAPVVAAQRQAIDITATAITKQVLALESYASHVAAADAARRDWESAQRLSQNNEKFREMIIRTAAGEDYAAILDREGKHAETAAQALYETLRSAVLAAEVLAL
jgi:hypothetical protein